MDNEFRYDPILNEWVIIAKNQSEKSVLSKKLIKDETKRVRSCPFCNYSVIGEDEWLVKWIPNKFSSLTNDPSLRFNIKDPTKKIYKQRNPLGNCEILLFSQNHNKNFGSLTIKNIEALITLWKERFSANMENEKLKYCFIFENRGKVFGVNLEHPHGELYSFPFIPDKVQRSFDSANIYWKTNNRCIFCDIIASEKQFKNRVIEENKDFIAFIPFYAKWPFEVHIYPKEHTPYILGIAKKKYTNFAQILRKIIRRLDRLYNIPMPYVMAHYNAPINSGEVDHYHYHIEIYPHYRGKDLIKYLGGVELTTNVMINPSKPAENAKILRDLKINLN